MPSPVLRDHLVSMPSTKKKKKTRKNKKEENNKRTKEGNVIFNDALNTCFIYGYMASDIYGKRPFR